MARKSVKSKKSTRKPTDRQKALGSPYARAVLNPKDGPLVGVPQFVPIKSHVARVRAIMTHDMTTTGCSIFFNPMGMVANDYKSIVVFANANGSAIDDADPTGITDANSFASANGTYSISDFSGANDLKARVVGAMIRVCNTSNAQVRDGVFTALHEPHHHGLENYTTSDMAKRSESIILPANAGQWVTLKYRTVRPQEVEEWQITPGVLTDDDVLHTGDTGDGSAGDMYPGYMRIDLKGCSTSGQALQIEAYAIIEYVGETVQALVRHTGVTTQPRDVPHVTKAAQIQEMMQIGKNRDLSKELHDFLHNLHNNPIVKKFETIRGWAAVKGQMLKAEEATHDIVQSTEQLIAAEIANAPYVATKTNGDIKAIQEEIRRNADIIPELNDLEVVKVMNNNKDVIIKNTRTGEIGVSFAGTTHEGVEDAFVNWMFNNPSVQAGYKSPQHVRSGNSMAEALVMAEGDASRITTFGHSQGAAYAMDYAERYKCKSVTFDPAIYRGQKWVDAEHLSFRTKVDPVSAGFSPRVTFGLKDTGTLKLETIGVKLNTFEGSAAKLPKQAIADTHSINQFRIMPEDRIASIDQGGIATVEEGIASTRMTGAASAAKVLEKGGVALQAAVTAGEVLSDVGEATGAIDAIAEAGVDVATDVVETVEIGTMAASGAAMGAALGPIGAAVGGVLGASVGLVESVALDKARSAIKTWIHKHHFWF